VALGDADFAPAVEAAFFDGLRRNLFSRYDPPRAGVRLGPRFATADGGSPRCAGFAVTLPTPAGGEHRVEFGLSWFRRQAERIVTELVQSGTVPVNRLVLFHLAAYLDEGNPAARPGEGMILEAEEPAVPVRPGSRRALGPAVPWDDPRPEDLPVLIPRRVLEDAVAEARRDPDQEVGGVLLGHLRRDPDDGQLFLEVTCHVPAQGTEADATSVTFTADTWAHARQLADLRGEGEIFVGWVHSHPFALDEPCPEPVPAERVGEVLFFSRHDRFVMEQAFARPFMVALQTAVEPRLERALGHLPVRLYGWRDGEVVARGFEVLEAS
jgi:proteasome lid subunit RPN8/RPN11